MNSAPYLHLLHGRMRVKIVGVKDSPTTATAVERRLLAMIGVTSAQANPLTGNVLIHFEPTLISANEILQSLKLHNYQTPTQTAVYPAVKSAGRSTVQTATQPVVQAIAPYHPPVAQVGGRVAEVVFWKAVEVAAERLILALL